MKKEFVSTRCNFGYKLTIDNHGDLYHCFSTVGNKNDLLGNFKNIQTKRIKTIMSVNNYNKCKYCFAKYLCGGTCYGDIINQNFSAQETECTFRKEVAKLSIHFYITVTEKNLLPKLAKYILY